MVVDCYCNNFRNILDDIIFTLFRIKKNLKKGKSRTFHGLDPEISTVIAVCLGKKGTGYNDLEGLDEGRDQIRNAVARL